MQDEGQFFDEIVKECRPMLSREVHAALFDGGIERFKEVIRAIESIFLAYPAVFGSMMFDLMAKAYSLRYLTGQSTEVIMVPGITGRHDN